MRSWLPPGLILGSARAVKEIRRCCDSFDGRLFRRNLVCIQTRRVMRLESLRAPDHLIEMAPGLRPGERFARQLPESELRTRLEEILGVRALISYARLVAWRQTGALLDDNQKTVARLTLETVSLLTRPHPVEMGVFLILQPLHGYSAVTRQIQSRFQQSGAGAPTDHPFLIAQPFLPVRPDGYRPAMHFEFQSQTSWAQAFAALGNHLLTVIEANEEGVRRDTDTEFLHDLRVATRRIRALLGQFRPVLTDARIASHRTAFREIGDRTNRLRDLDIQLLNERRYRETLPDDFQSGLNSFFGQLRQERIEIFQDVRRYLHSARYRRLKASWRTFLSRVPDDAADPLPDAIELKDLAHRGLKRLRRRIDQIIGTVGENPSDDHLHQLRIAFKKYRYWIEFFHSLWPAQELSPLRELQDCLGEFNDLVMLQHGLRTFLDRLRPDTPQAVNTASALGALLIRLHDAQNQKRTFVSELISGFVGTA